MTTDVEQLQPDEPFGGESRNALFEFLKVSIHTISKTKNANPVFNGSILTEDQIDGQIKNYLTKLVRTIWEKPESKNHTVAARWRDDLPEGQGLWVNDLHARVAEDLEHYDQNLVLLISSYYAGAVVNSTYEEALVGILFRRLGDERTFWSCFKVPVADDSRLHLTDAQNAKVARHLLESALSSKVLKGALVPHPDPNALYHLKVLDDQAAGVSSVARYFLNEYLQAVADEPPTAQIDTLYKSLQVLQAKSGEMLSVPAFLAFSAAIAEADGEMGTDEAIELIQEHFSNVCSDTIEKDVRAVLDRKPFKLGDRDYTAVGESILTIGFQEDVEDFRDIKLTGPPLALLKLMTERDENKTRFFVNYSETPIEVDPKPKIPRKPAGKSAGKKRKAN